jgi:integrase
VIDSVGQEFKKLFKLVDIKGRRGFYGLRHTFKTVAGESRDQVAVDRVMGHTDKSMAANYRARISDARLIDVVNVVRAWLWPDSTNGGDELQGDL